MNQYAQLYFQVNSNIPWKTLIKHGKETFKKENLSILLKRTVKEWNRK